MNENINNKVPIELSYLARTRALTKDDYRAKLLELSEKEMRKFCNSKTAVYLEDIIHGLFGGIFF